MHRNNILIYIQKYATLHSLFYLETAVHISGAQVSTASGIFHTVTAICRYRGRVETGLSMLWVAYATHSILKQVPTLPR